MKSDKTFFERLDTRIALAFLLLSLLSISLFAFVMYRLSGSLFAREDMRRTRASLEQSSEYVSSYLEKLKSFSSLIAMHPDIRSALAKSDKKSLESISALTALAENSDPRIRAVAVISKEGFLITSGSSMAMPLSGDMMQEKWYQDALSSAQMPTLASTGHGVFTMDREDWIISVCQEIRGEGGEHLGLVLIDVSYRFIEDYLSSLDLGKDGYSFILSDEGSLIYHPDPEIFEDEERKSSLLSLAGAGGAAEKGGGRLYRVPIPGSSWTLYGICSADNARLLRSRLLRSVSVFAAALVLLSIALASLLSRTLASPIRKLSLAMSRADKTWEEIEIPSGSPGEVRALSLEYNRLLHRIRALTENIRRKEEARRLFELRALQSQINPHFLYNTLDTILWLSELGENQQAARVCGELGRMLRVSLNIDQAFIPLGRELEHCRSYLEIQKTRYEDMFSYCIEGEESLLSLYVPKLILQPIAENAIYHGIRSSGKRGKISILFQIEGDALILEIKDDGIGFSKKGGEENAGDAHPGEEGAGSSAAAPKKRPGQGGIGLSNVGQRIRLLCGESYGLFVRSSPGKGTRVRIRLPLRFSAD